MNTLNENSLDTLIMLRGCEVYSINYEGIVYISGSDVLLEGEVIDTLNTNRKVSRLFKEYCEENC